MRQRALVLAHLYSQSLGFWTPCWLSETCWDYLTPFFPMQVLLLEEFFRKSSGVEHRNGDGYSRHPLKVLITFFFQRSPVDLTCLYYPSLLLSIKVNLRISTFTQNFQNCLVFVRPWWVQQACLIVMCSQSIALHSAKLHFVSALQSLSHTQKLDQFRKIHWQPGWDYTSSTSFLYAVINHF